MLRSSSVQRRKEEAVETHENGHNREGERNNPSSGTGAGAPATGGQHPHAPAAAEPQLRRGRTRLPERFQPDVIMAIAAGGALGAPARYEVAQLVTVAPGGFPWATFSTNLSGAFVLGFFLTFVIERLPPTRFLRPFFAVGFLGSYTTFSTLAVETVLLVKNGHVALGIGYTLASVSAGLALAYLGIVLARSLPGGEYR